MAKKKLSDGAPLSNWDEAYFALMVKPLRACAAYKPKFGKGGKIGLTLDQFQALYQADPFYNWVGLDSPRRSTATWRPAMFRCSGCF